ncbi:MAG: ABC transporter substrate-binding protein [Dehalococcoidia bacterium]|nr:ABC transporter substrate-binding protein [Dehalococcoidia bacterium]
MNKLSLFIQRPPLVAIILISLLALVLACGPGEQPAPTSTAKAVATPTTTGAVATPTPTSRSAPTATPTTVKPSGTLRVASEQLAGENVDPFLALTNARVFTTLIYDFIVDVDRDGVVDPKRSLAESWSVGPGNTYYELSIRRGVKFHNGEELNAEDVKFHIERQLAEGSQSANVGILRSFIDRVELVDPYKVRVYTKTPTPFLLYYLSPLTANDGAAVPKDYITLKGNDAYRANPVGSGPYAFAEQRIGDFLKLSAVEGNHWKSGVPRYQEILLRVIPEQQTRIALLKTDAIDIIGTTNQAARELEQQGFKIHVKPDAYNVHLYYNEQWLAPFNDIRVREALSISIDREAINKSLFAGLATIEGDVTVLSRSDIAYKGQQPPMPYDPARARTLLKDAGQSNLQITLWTYPRAGVPEGQRMLEAIASMWGAVGVNVTMKASDYSTYRAAKAARKLGPAQVAWIASPGGALTAGISGYTREGLLPLADDEKLFQLVNEMLAVSDVETYIVKANAVAKHVRDNFISGALYRVGAVFVTSPKITEWHFTTVPASWDLLNLAER